MGRDEKEQILILKTYKVGEKHRGCKLLTPGSGVISALVYGGNGKNSFKKGAVIPFCYGQGELVHARDRYQLKEFYVDIGFDGVRSDLRKMYMASLWAEVIMSSYGGGHQGAELFSLLLESLAFLQDSGDEPSEDRVMIRFLWVYLDLSGERPDSEHCVGCGRPFRDDLYRDRRGRLYCRSCSHGDMGKLPFGILAYLKRIDETGGEEFLRIGIARESLAQLKRWLYTVLQDHMEYPLKTMKTGGFLL